MSKKANHMDSLYYHFNELTLTESDLTKEELDAIDWLARGSIIELRKELFRVDSVNPLILTLFKNVGIGSRKIVDAQKA